MAARSADETDALGKTMIEDGAERPMTSQVPRANQTRLTVAGGACQRHTDAADLTPH